MGVTSASNSYPNSVCSNDIGKNISTVEELVMSKSWLKLLLEDHHMQLVQMMTMQILASHPNGK